MATKNIEYQNIIYMKYGVHASEDPRDIISRKQKEIKKIGWTLWGYGGRICYPTTQVQPFVQKCMSKSEPVHLIMEFTESRHISTTNRAEYYSVEKPYKKYPDKTTWQEIPETIDVYGSKLALCIKKLTVYEKGQELCLNKDEYEIAVGPSKGKILNNYIRGRCDKGCAKRIVNQAEKINNDNQHIAIISLTAEIIVPYAVFVK